MATKTPRSVPYKVTLTPELHERLREVAAQLGQAPATCASMAIGAWVNQMQRSLGASEQVLDHFIESLAKEVGPDLREHMKGLK